MGGILWWPSKWSITSTSWVKCCCQACSEKFLWPSWYFWNAGSYWNVTQNHPSAWACWGSSWTRRWLMSAWHSKLLSNNKFFDRTSVVRLFPNSGEVTKSPIFVCSNFSENRRWPTWVETPFSKWPDYRIGEIWRIRGWQLASLSFSPNFLSLLGA